jgi:hypothetical protein
MGCCTDLSCTAYVVNGITSYATTTTEPARATITDAPPTTTVVRTAPIVPQLETWYWTVTWWYRYYYWTTFRATTSSVTYSTVYTTTTFTTTATDQEAARSIFSELKSTFSLPVPASATSLADLMTSRPTDVATEFSEGDVQSTEVVESSRPTSRMSTTNEAAPMPTFPQSISATTGVRWMEGGVAGWAVLCGVLMVWL